MPKNYDGLDELLLVIKEQIAYFDKYGAIGQPGPDQNMLKNISKAYHKFMNDGIKS